PLSSFAHPRSLSCAPRRSSDLVEADVVLRRLEPLDVTRPHEEAAAVRLYQQPFGHGPRGARGTGTSARRAPRDRTAVGRGGRPQDRKSTRLNSSHQIISYAVFC